MTPGDAAAAAARRPPSADELVALGEAVLHGFPPEIRKLVGAVPVRVQDWPDDATLDDLGIDDALELTGLFRGVPLGERHAMALPSAEPEMIFLYRLPILHEWCERGVALEEVVFDVLTHEIAHFFGLDEAGALRLEGRTVDGSD